MTETPTPVRDNSRLWKAIAALLAIGVVALVWAWFDMQRDHAYVAPDFTLNTFDNQTYHLTDLRGRIVVLNFWASWCAPCRAEAPDLQALASRFAPEDLTVLGIAYQDTPDKSKAYLKELNLTYPNGAGDAIAAAYRVQGLPTTIIINREGIVTDTILAGVELDDLLKRIDRVNKASATATP